MTQALVPNPASVHRAGLLLAVAGAIAFSGKAIIVKLAYRHGVDAATLIMYRMLFALPLFLLMAWWAERQPLARAQPLTRKDVLGIVGLGFMGYYLSSYLDFLGLQYVSASLERLILYLNPTLVVLLGRALFAAHAPTHAAPPPPTIEIIDASRTMTDAGPVLDDWQAAIGGTLVLSRVEAWEVLPRALFDRVEDAADAAARKAEEIARDRDADVRAFRNE